MEPLAPPIPPRPPMKKPGRAKLSYADVVPRTHGASGGASPLAPINTITEKSVYSDIKGIIPSKQFDCTVTMETIMLQLRPLAYDWVKFAAAVNLKEVQYFAQYLTNEDALELVIALWINDIGRIPRWTEVGGLVEYCGIKHVGSGICDVYKTGRLPVPIDMNIDNSNQKTDLHSLLPDWDFDTPPSQLVAFIHSIRNSAEFPPDHGFSML